MMTMLAQCPYPDVPAEHFAVTYAINPWMDPSSWARDQRVLTAASRREWTRLASRAAGLRARRSTWCRRQPGLPDLVFTANAAVVLDGKALLARFRHPERQRRGAAFRGCLPQAAGARPDRRRCARCPRAWRSKAPATASGTTPAACSGWATARAPTRPRDTWSRTSSASRCWRSSSPIRASITWTPRSARCRAAR